MSGGEIGFILAGAFAGGLINGLAGTGTALFALGFLMVALNPLSAVGVVVLMSVVTGLQGLWEVRAALRENMARRLRFILPGLVGVPVGVLLLRHMDATVLKLLIAALLILYGGFFSFRATLPKFERRTPVLDSMMGFSGGFLGGMAGLSGALLVIWLSMRPWPKAETRAVLQPFNVAILGLTALMLWHNGVYDATTMTAFFIALPASFLAVQIGLWLFRRISDTAFRRLLIGRSLLLGLGTLASVLL
ncbi:MAG: sulfite exporter TauE/SafE family protein [Roseinatronobacter sp.]|nr:sulfite exporter TauE/SafE family protein [Roseinatronobacter sp.]